MSCDTNKTSTNDIIGGKEMDHHKVEFPWDIKKRSAEVYIKALIIECGLNTPVSVIVVMPSQTYKFDIT